MEQKNQNQKNVSRRDFMKIAGATAAGAAVASTIGCGNNDRGFITKCAETPIGKMTYRRDPKNGNMLSLLGFGMMRLPQIARRRGESLPDTNDLDQEAVNELVDCAIEHGVNVFDTAPVYCKGFSEKSTGIALSRHPRDKYFIATKLSNMRGNSHEREHSIAMYHKSMEDLQVDYIDYYFAHNIGNHEVFRRRYIDNGVLDFMFAEKEAGRIRNVGFSFHGDGDFFEWVSKEYPWDFGMIQLNYLDWGLVADERRTNIDAKRQYEILSENEIPVWIMEPLLGGLLAMPHYKARELMTRADPEASAASWAMRFAGNLPNVTTVLSGMRFIEHVRDNVCTYSPCEPLSDTEREMLIGDVAKIAYEYRNINCTRCQYCMPCPYGLDIPEIFTHYNRSMNEGHYPVDRQDPHFAQARRAFLVGMDRAVPSVRQAGRCITCNLCLNTCPQRINIPREMQRIDNFVSSLRTEV